MNTVIRLVVLIPAAIICPLIALLAVGFGGLSVGSVALGLAIALSPYALLAWTITDHRKRHNKRLG
jgi:ABC-type nickel/cobalt efflux system permease component RcnA